MAGSDQGSDTSSEASTIRPALLGSQDVVRVIFISHLDQGPMTKPMTPGPVLALA
jgi:hypothetical protein